MAFKRDVLKSFAVFVVLLMETTVSFAQGINYPGTSPVINSGAGNARTDTDNLMIRNNPAGMTELPVTDAEEESGAPADNSKGKWRFMGEAQGIYYNFRRDFTVPGAPSTVTSGATIASPTISGEITYTSKNHKYAFGVGAYQIFGFQSKSKEPIEVLGARAQFFDTKTASNDLAFAAAYRIHPKLSVGGAFVFGRGFLDVKAPIAELALLGITQQSRLNVSAVGAPGVTLGVSFRPSDKIGFGINYKSKRKYNLNGELESVQPVLTSGGLQLLPLTTEAEVEFKLPAIIESGIRVRPTKNLTLAADFRFYDYTAALQNLVVRARASNALIASQRIDAKDVRLYILGGIYNLNPQTKIHFGSAYTTNGFPARFLNPGLYNSGGSEVSGGVGRKVAGRWVNIGLMGIFGRERTITPAQNPFFAGKYTSKGFVFAVGLRS